ncbi:4a-hydroxytetrahydrobiopterin dehydratase [Streptomyces sp. RK9]|uniref:4a-hydroxytetrahydrobiopterin dehydratase n=1 Tax=Streptomyces sp. RK9 TaxID=3239284 RepID=UPI003867C845
MPLEPLSQKEIEDRLAELPGWSLTSAPAAADDSAAEVKLTRAYGLPSHFAATAFVVHVSQVQEELGHHAELTLGYNTVTLAVNTHSAGGALTDLDFELARRVEALATGHGAE